MGYPEPIPAVKGKAAEEFEKKLQKFKLTRAQKEFYREAKRVREEEAVKGASISLLFSHEALHICFINNCTLRD
jgi:hypothetical protein